MCLIQQVPNRGGLPFAPAARRSLTHLVQLGGNIAQRKIRISTGNRCNELHQVILWGHDGASAPKARGRQASRGPSDAPRGALYR